MADETHISCIPFIFKSLKQQMTSDTRPEASKDKENERQKDAKPREKESSPSKVVLRRLPPCMTGEKLLDQLSPVPDYNYFYFCPADKSLGRAAFSRAYINFLNQEDLYVFTEKFDNYVFLDDKGGEYPAMVEYAPYQKIPKKRPKKSDTRKGTLDKDPDYLKFLEAYDNPQTTHTTVTPELILEEIESREKELKANHGVLKISTPLLEFVRKKREEKKQARDKYREERKKRDDDRRKKKEEDRKRKKERERERQQEKERERKKDRERYREEESKDKPMKMLIKQNEDRGKSKKSSETDAGYEERKYNQKEARSRGKDIRPKEKPERDSDCVDHERIHHGLTYVLCTVTGDPSIVPKEKPERDSERVDRERKRREKEDEEERKWRERERERREKRERERKEREKKERERRDREKKERERKQQEVQKQREEEEDETPQRSESASKVDIRSILKVDVMKDSTSSLEDQDSTERSGDSRGQRSKARYKDRPERQIYNPGQRAAERRKQMELKKESTPEPREGGQGEGGSKGSEGYRGQGRRGRKDRTENYDDYRSGKKD